MKTKYKIPNKLYSLNIGRKQLVELNYESSIKSIRCIN